MPIGLWANNEVGKDIIANTAEVVVRSASPALLIIGARGAALAYRESILRMQRHTACVSHAPMPRL